MEKLLSRETMGFEEVGEKELQYLKFSEERIDNEILLPHAIVKSITEYPWTDLNFAFEAVASHKVRKFDSEANIILQTEPKYWNRSQRLRFGQRQTNKSALLAAQNWIRFTKREARSCRRIFSKTRDTSSH